jgi:hypothetical protein
MASRSAYVPERPVAAVPAAEYRITTSNRDFVVAASYEDYSVNWRDFSFGFLSEDYSSPGQ